MTDNKTPRYDRPYDIPRHPHYMLRYRKPIPCDVYSADKVLCDIRKRRVRLKYFTDDLLVSTMFTCLDYNIFGPLPLLFETAVCRDGECDIISRCSTWRNALRMHRYTVERIKAEITT